MTAAAIAGTFSDLRTVKTRGICQLVIEIPIEQADTALAALGGVPQPGKEKWVALAPLQESPRSAHLNPSGEGTVASEATPVRAGGEPTKEKCKWSSMKWVERFGILCDDMQFRKWVDRYAPRHYSLHNGVSNFTMVPMKTGDTTAARYVRWWCRVDSRTKIDGNPDAEARAQVLMNEWQAFTGRGSPRP